MKTTGNWFRFTNYVIDSDQNIRPTDDASVHVYSPWDAYWASREEDGDPPYQGLVKLAEEITDLKRRGEMQDVESIVSSWCAEWGPLGYAESPPEIWTEFRGRGLENILRPYRPALGSFIFAATSFEAAVINSARLAAGDVPTRGRPGWRWLNLLAKDTRLAIIPSDGRFTENWESATLLSAFASMAQLDLLGGRRLVQCEGCGRLHFSSRPVVRHCSPTCRWRSQQRRRRERRSRDGL